MTVVLGTLQENLNICDIVFANEKFGEMIKLCGNGDIYVRGKLTENDKEVVQGMRDLLAKAKDQ
jgi:hypothetical protein